MGDKTVVDLYCHSAIGKVKDFDSESIGAIWSSGKMVAKIMLAIMVDKRHLSYDEKVSTYWPEFA